MKLLFATGNCYKYELMRERLKELEDIDLINTKSFNLNIDVVEDGKTAEENAIKKVLAYYNESRCATIAEDSGLYIDKFNESEQPGLFVKRVRGVDGLSDEEVLEYYINKLNEYGGESLAHYYTGVCIVDSDGNVYSDTINEKDFLLTSDVCPKETLSGGILGKISYDINAKKYFVERNEEDIKNHYKELDNQYRELVKRYLLKKH